MGATYFSRNNALRPVLAFLAGLLGIACLGFAAQTASAAVQVDPDGPAGQQYALPLDSVRAESAGDPSAGVPGAEKAPPLFGQGVSPIKERGSSSGRGSDPNRSGGKSGRNRSAVSGAGIDGTEVKRAIEILENGSGSGSSATGELIALIGAISIIGLVAGLVGRRAL